MRSNKACESDGTLTVRSITLGTFSSVKAQGQRGAKRSSVGLRKQLENRKPAGTRKCTDLIFCEPLRPLNILKNQKSEDLSQECMRLDSRDAISRMFRVEQVFFPSSTNPQSIRQLQATIFNL